jgi:hypothetical protein
MKRTMSRSRSFGGVGVDEVEALAHEGLFEVEDHAGEVDEALGIDEDADVALVAVSKVKVRSRSRGLESKRML